MHTPGIFRGTDEEMQATQLCRGNRYSTPQASTVYRSPNVESGSFTTGGGRLHHPLQWAAMEYKTGRTSVPCTPIQ
uniref:Uncharacterized protein n=1 Tax=Anguilla anguilla TaxID=7936 RepID=A0A0E9R5G2_ANGAN